MQKSIAIYGSINSESATKFVQNINDADRFSNDIRVRISTNGGDVMQGYAILSMLKEFEGEKSVVVDGKAYSMGAFMCMYVNDVEAYDVSKFMVHRADYPAWYKNSEFFKESDQDELDKINADLKKAMKKKLDADAWKSITGDSIDDVFDSEERKDYFLSAKEAKKVGLISKILTLDSDAKREINANCRQANIAALYDEKNKEQKLQKEAKEQNVKSKNKNMTIEELKKDHPELVKAIREEVTADIRLNIEAWAEYKDVSPEKVIEGVSTMKAPNAKDYAKFAKLQMAGVQMAEKAEGESPEASGQETPETGKEEKEEKESLTDGVNALFK